MQCQLDVVDRGYITNALSVDMRLHNVNESVRSVSKPFWDWFWRECDNAGADSFGGKPVLAGAGSRRRHHIPALQFGANGRTSCYPLVLDAFR